MSIVLSPLWNSTSEVSVKAIVEVAEQFLQVSFAVQEPQKCFCQNKECDGEFVWQDSCVEVFLEMLDGSGDYVNFEFNSKGVCYSARGKDRQNRTELTNAEYLQIERNASEILFEGTTVRWFLFVKIPFALLHAKWDDLRAFPIRGNIYKCADNAQEPHYLSAFPIKTEKPDFHRPEFFSEF
ncbi:hypothetical protein AGMMS49938_06030 [Fibrobacterales bacterium]|nr:hypothetical protein AGMMS49938_06030 [Fibrobacterales bacterium]